MITLVFPSNASQIIFMKVFAHPVWKQALLYQFKNLGQKSATLLVPTTLVTKLKDKISGDSDLSPLKIKILPMQDNQGGLPLNRLFIDKDSFIDIFNNEDLRQFRKSRKENILEQCQTPVAKYLNKRISLPLSSVLARLDVRPNTISLVALMMSFIGAACLLNEKLFLLAFVFFQINSILDGSDGEVARFNLRASEFGKKLDIYSDYATSGLLIVFEAIGIHFFFKQDWVLATGLLSIFFLVCVALVWICSILLKWTPENFADVESLCHQKLAHPSSPLEWINRIFLFMSQRDFYLLVLFILSIFQQFIIIHLFILFVSFSWFCLSLYTLSLIRSLKQKETVS